jgi:isopentenyl diphosphate isomerase/L-lactate dehydrogenase-like FMN-dependent dehydrogenase
MRQVEWTTRRDHHTWQDFAWLRDAWPRRLFVKGILCVEDAQLAAEHGADGIFVSNHGGRQLDGLPSPMEVLPAIAAAVGERLAVMVDGGFRRGTDIVKALALGAHGVFVGRPVIWGLAVDGADGVRAVLHELTTELERAMKLCGVRTLDELTADLVIGPS